MKPVSKRFRPMSAEEAEESLVKALSAHVKTLPPKNAPLALSPNNPPTPSPATDEAQQIDQLNSLPLNQEAKAWLQKVGKQPDSDFQYLLLLTQWGLANGLRLREDLQADFMNRFEELLYHQDQEGVYQYILTSPGLPYPEEAQLQPGDLEKQPSALDAAHLVLDAIMNALIGDETLVPPFPPGPPLRD